MRDILLIILFLFSGTALAEQQIDLNGFRLWQLKSAVDKNFDKPFKELDRGNVQAKAYGYDESTYMIFEFPKDTPNNISAIQITGYTNNMLPFRGLKLGDDAKRVVQILGEPSEIIPIPEVKVFRYIYPDSNFSIEVDEDNRLYSIRIGASKAILEDVDLEFKHWDAFVDAIKSKDKIALLDLLRPDMEIYKDGEVISIDNRYSNFIKDDNTKFYDLFFADSNSVFSGVNKDEAHEEVRLLQGLGVGIVHKFYDSKILKEIVFFPYNGNMRVYEVAFR